VASLRETVSVFIDKELSPEANRQRLIKTAKQVLADTIASGKASKRYTTAVDGRIGPIEQAQKQVAFKFQYLAEAVAFALGFLQARVPKDSGETAKSFWVSVNDRYYSPGTFDPNTANVPPDADIVIGNLVPQWRKMDLNLVGTRTLHYRYPGEIDDCVRALSRQFGNIVTASRKYDYRFPNKYVPVKSPTRKPYRYNSPVLIIKAR